MSIVGPVLNLYGGEPTDGVSGWRNSMNSALAKLDAVVSLSVKTKSALSKPTVGVSAGDRYLVAFAAGWDNQPIGTIAVYGYGTNGAANWNYYVPIDGMVCYVVDEAKNYRYLSGVWSEMPSSASTFIIPNIGEVGGSYVTGQVGNFLVDTFDKTVYGACEYTIYVKHESVTPKFQVNKFIVTHDSSTNTFVTDYAKIYSNTTLATFSSEISGNNVRLLATSITTPLTVRVMKILINI